MNMMRAVTLKGFGGPDVLQLSRIPRAGLVNPTDVLIKVVAAGVNRDDLAQRRGRTPAPEGASEVLGIEVSGHVAAVGSDVKNVKEGDKVMALLRGGGYAEYCTSHYGTVMPIPHGYSFVEAAAIPESFVTAWQCLHQTAALQLGSGVKHKVLVHAGASGVSMATAQIVEKYFEGTAITTSSASKLDICKNYARINIDRAVDETGNCFAPKVNAAVGEGAVDLIIDPIFGSSYMTENASVLKKDGKIIVLSFLGGSRVLLNCLPLLRKRATVIFSKLRDRHDDYRTEVVQSFVREILPLMEERAIVPVETKSFNLEDVAIAHDRLDDKRAYGKKVLIVNREAGGVGRHFSRRYYGGEIAYNDSFQAEEAYKNAHEDNDPDTE